MAANSAIITDAKYYAFRHALHTYANEPCRICGRLLTVDDIHDDAKFVGYSADNKSRAAHRRCWEGFIDIVRDAHSQGYLERILNEDAE